MTREELRLNHIRVEVMAREWCRRLQGRNWSMAENTTIEWT